MKSNFFKYAFIIFAVAIMIFAIIKMKNDNKEPETPNYQAEEVKEEAVTEMRLGVATFDSMNPILSKNKNIQDITKIIFEPLMTLSADYKLENCLAKEWAKQNATTYLIKLRDDKKWSNGEKFTTDDVKFTIDRLKDSDSIYSANVQYISQIEVVDSTTIKIILSQEVPFFEYNLTFPILSNSYYSDKEFNADIVPIGTGMYKVSDVKGSTILLDKNEYHEDKNKLKITNITITTYSNMGELYNAFKTGSVDIVATQNANLKDYIGTIGYTSKEMKGREHCFIAFNTQGQVLSQKSVRQAISYSIDKSNIVASIYGENCYTSNFPLDYGNWLYTETSDTEYNLDKAKIVLMNDGWNYSYRNWNKVIDRKTQKISLNFVVKASDPAKLAVAQNIKAQLENQGIRINLIQANDEQYKNYLNTKNYDMILCSINLSLSPNLTTFFGENNLANYTNEEVTNLMNEIKNSRDDQKLIDDYKRLTEIYKTEVPYFSLFNNKYIVAYNSGINGTLTPNWFYLFYNIDDWHR